MSRVPGTTFNPFFQVDQNGSFSRANAQAAQRVSAQPVGPNGRVERNVQANADLARSLLIEGGKSEAQTRRLNKIVQASDANARRVQQSRDDFVFKRLVDARLDPNNPLSDGEFNQLRQQLEAESLIRAAPNPVQLRNVEEESDNPALVRANAAKNFSAKFGQSESYISSLLIPDAKTGQVDAKTMLSVAKFLAEQGRPSSKQMSATSTALRLKTKQLEQFKKRGIIFDTDGNAKPRPTPDFGSGFGLGSDNKALIEEFDAELRNFQNAQVEVNSLESQVQGFSEAFTPSSSPTQTAGTSAPVTQVPASVTGTPSPFGVLRKLPEGVGTLNNPAPLRDDVPLRQQAAEAIAEAQRRKQSVWILDENGVPREFKYRP